MDFATLKKLLEQQKLQQGGGPVDLGNTADMASNMAIKKGLDDSFGDVKTADSIQPTDSPIDYLAGGLGAKLGGAMARDAGAVVGNEVGSIGGDVLAGQSRKTSEQKFQKLREMLEEQLRAKGAIGQGAGGIADEAIINKEMLNVAQRGAETGHMSPFDLNVMAEKANRAATQLNTNQAQQSQKFKKLFRP